MNRKWNTVGGWGDFLPAIGKSGGWGDFFPTSMKPWQIGIHRVRKSTALGNILSVPNY